MAHVPTYAPGELSPDDLLTLEVAAKARALTFSEAFRLIDALRTAWDEAEKAEEKLNSAPDTEYEFGYDTGFKDGEGEGYNDGIETGKGLMADALHELLEEAAAAGLSYFETLARVRAYLSAHGAE
jgi:flagellar biosynthesis/type III secretory pathway protein FliH